MDDETPKIAGSAATLQLRIFFGLIVLIVCVQVWDVVHNVVTPPRQNVEKWLVVSDTDMAHCTILVQTLVVALILVGVSTAVITSLTHRAFEAISATVLSAWMLLMAVFNIPSWMLGTRYAYPYPPADCGACPLDPIPAATNFNYVAYESRLLPTLAALAEWASGAAALIGVAGYLIARARRPATTP